MGDRTAIQWSDATWNPIGGCRRRSPGCQNCYAERMAARLREMGQALYVQDLTTGNGAAARWTGNTAEAAVEMWHQPLRWSRPRRIFVCSMSDLFYEGFADEQVARVFAVMAACQRHTFQVLTKRSFRMKTLMQWPPFVDLVKDEHAKIQHQKADGWPGWPLPNVVLGVSAEDQERWDERVPDLLECPAAAHFVSIEPLIGPIDPDPILAAHPARKPGAPQLQLIVGGESGHGARPMHPEWARRLRDSAKRWGCLFFFKQWGAWVPIYARDSDPDARSLPMERVGKKAAGRVLDGRTWDEEPQVLARINAGMSD